VTTHKTHTLDTKYPTGTRPTGSICVYEDDTPTGSICVYEYVRPTGSICVYEDDTQRERGPQDQRHEAASICHLANDTEALHAEAQERPLFSQAHLDRHVHTSAV
jgi:hypothetical protein